MNQVQSLTQAYSQAPWRKQLQWIGVFLLLLILIALVAGIYLSVSAQAASIGREIQSEYARMEQIERNIEDLQTQLADLTASTVMQERAEQLGFVPVTPDKILYIPVSDYIRPAQVTLGGPPGRNLPGPTQVSPEFTESLFDWLRERVFEPAAPLLQEVKP